MVNSYRYVFAASTSTIPVSGTTVDLGIGEIGVFDGKTFQATNGVTAKSILIAQGTPDTVYPHGVAKSNHTYKTNVIKGSAVKSWKKVNGKKGSGLQITLGYDGADLTKNLTVKQGKAFTFWVTLSGAPIANLLGDSPKTHYAVWTEQFTVQLPCVSECTDTCGDVFDPNVVGDAVIEEFGKRKIIGAEFIRVFEDAALEISQSAGIDFLVQGTLYPDVVESGGGSGSANIKSHHNVGGLPDDLKFNLVEPLRDLFKDEVREVGLNLGLPEEIVWRQPFPGPGLGIRIVGEVTENNLRVLRKADAIAREELKLAKLDRAIWQCPVVLLADVRSVGVQGDGRTYGHPIVLRPVSSEDAMTADWSRIPYEVLEKISTRITNEVSEVNRVVLDVTSKPPGTIEWE